MFSRGLATLGSRFVGRTIPARASALCSLPTRDAEAGSPVVCSNTYKKWIAPPRNPQNLMSKRFLSTTRVAAVATPPPDVGAHVASIKVKAGMLDEVGTFDTWWPVDSIGHFIEVGVNGALR